MSLFPRLIAEEAVEYGGKVRVLAPEVGATGVGKLARIAFDCSTEVLASTALGRPDQDLDGVLPKAKPGHVGRPSALFLADPKVLRRQHRTLRRLPPRSLFARRRFFLCGRRSRGHRSPLVSSFPPR